jgi:uncharacterized membrane protein YagU involved in acid resistance
VAQVCEVILSASTTVRPAEKTRVLPAILWGGLLAGVLDITVAFIRWGKPARILQGIASGVLGPAAFRGGMATVALGAALHFSIALSAAAVYYATSRKLAFLRQRAVVWGLFYGIAVYMFMSWIVVPLSAFPNSKPPFSLTSLVLSLLTHMFCVGLPIALVTRRYS